MLGKLLPYNFLKSAKTKSLQRSLLFEQCEPRRMLSVVPPFASNPTSTNKIYLDFDGQTIADTYWTDPFAGSNISGNGGDPIHAPIYNMPGDSDYEFDTSDNKWKPLPFNQEELVYIELAWRQIAEDFSPFDVDVTTIEPDGSFFTSGGPNGERALRVLFTTREDDGRLNNTANAGNNWQGISNNWIGDNTTSGIGTDPDGPSSQLAWNATVDRPVWVFANHFDGTPLSLWQHPDKPVGSQDWGPIQEYVGLIGSHEIGHGMGLDHDGVNENLAVSAYEAPTSPYYAGHTSGATDAPTSWGPIMGGAELRSLTQWSDGDYLGATDHFGNTNTQDDLAIIAGHLGYRADDHGGSLTGSVLNPTGATELTLDDGFTSADGIIERSSSTTNDYDVFEIDLGSSSVSTTIRIDTPAPAIVAPGAGLDVGVEGNFVGVSNLDVEMRIYAAGNLNTPLYTNPSDGTTNAVHTFTGSGKYYVVVDGVGYSPSLGAGYGYDDYGSLGQYTLTAAVDRDLYYVSTTVDQIDATNDDRWFSLREAVIAANADMAPAFIRVPRGRYALELVGSEQSNATVNDLDITKDVYIVGDGAGITIIDNSNLGTSNHRSFDVAAGGVDFGISQMTIANSSSASDSGLAVRVLANSSVTITDSAIVNHEVTSPVLPVDGASVYVAGGDVTIRRSVFTGNTTTTGSGAAVAVVGGGVDAPVITIGQSIFALNDDSNSHPNVYVGVAVVRTDEGDNLYDDESGGFFNVTQNATNHLGTPHYVVTTLQDTFNHCDDHEALSIREAVDLANVDINLEEEIWLPAWDFVLTKTGFNPMSSIDTTIKDIDVVGGLVVRGIDSQTTIQWHPAVIDEAIFALVGDTEPDDDNDIIDFGRFSDAFGSVEGDSNYDAQFDYNLNGQIEITDFGEFANSFGHAILLFGVLRV